MTTRKPKTTKNVRKQLSHVDAAKASRVKSYAALPTVEEMNEKLSAIADSHYNIESEKPGMFRFLIFIFISTTAVASFLFGFLSGCLYTENKDAAQFAEKVVKKHCSDYPGWHWSAEEGACVGRDAP